MILRYLERTNEAAKPTVALDYNYAKKPKNLDNFSKDVGHLWELGDGTFLTKLIDVVLTPETIAFVFFSSKFVETFVCRLETHRL